MIKEPIGIVYTDHINSSSNTILTEKGLCFLLLLLLLFSSLSKFPIFLGFLILGLSFCSLDLQLADAREHKYARVLSATDDEGHSQTDNIIKQIIQTTNQEEEEFQSDNGSDQESQQKTQVQVHLILISIFNCCLFLKKKNAMRTWAYAKSLRQLLFFIKV